MDLTSAKRIRALAQNGLAFSKDAYDIERYEELLDISLQMIADSTKLEKSELVSVYKDIGYATPKVDVRSIIMKGNKLLLVKEKAENLWSLPGGWADIGDSPAEVAVKEVAEEAGIKVRAVRPLAIFDKNKHAHPPELHHVYKICFLCEYVSGEIKTGLETNDVRYFEFDNLPKLSLHRITKSQIKIILDAIETKECYFD